MSTTSDKAQTSGALQVRGMILLSMGSFAMMLGWTIPLGLLSWPGAGSNDAYGTLYLGLMLLSVILFISGTLLLIASLFYVVQRWLLILGMFVLSVLAAFVQRWLFPASEPYASTNWILTFSGTALVLTCILISRTRGIWPALWRTLLVTSVSAAIVYAVAYVCGQIAAAGSGPIDGQPPPTSPIYFMVSLLVGSLDILIIYFWLTRRGREPNKS